MTGRLIAAVIAFLALPLIVFRGRTLRTYLITEVATYAFAAIVWRQLEGFDAYLAAVAFFVAKLVIFSLFVAKGEDVAWSANRAALIGLVVYALLIPAMQRTPIDGDEPYYLLITESLIQDRDLDLTNQYAHLEESQTNRRDLAPQLGDRGGRSHLEPVLPALLIPGYLLAGLSGAIATVVLFGALLIRSTMRWFSDEGIDEPTCRAVFPFVAFAPPIVFFAARIWPEVPAAFLFVEAIRGIRNRRVARWVPAIIALTALKLRFLLVAIPIVLRKRKLLAAFIAVVVITAALMSKLGLTTNPLNYLNGFFGLLLDGAAGIAFQAPFYLLGVFALTRWRSMPEGFREAMIAALLYVICLVPRSEWHGGWSPPLRYIVFLMPALALGAAAMWDRVSSSVIALMAVWSAGLVIHGVAYPWRLFHIANGENIVGETLSTMYRSDFSRLFPSFIRFNTAAWVGVVCFCAALLLLPRPRSGRGWPGTSGAGPGEGLGGINAPHPDPLPASRGEGTVFVLALAAFFLYGQTPGPVTHFEDAYVIHNGGELYPDQYTVARFNFRGGWLIHPGNSVSFLARHGPKTIYYASREPSLIRLGSRTYPLAATADAYRPARVFVDHDGRIELQCLTGSVNLDRIE